ncbi:hypothetical protein [Streptomyces triticisoli]|uniref:hypothetical protein n=1 Tax=Streptomyces triticisoli TaxID=2182797 RepID=UPI001E2C6AB6|nr:hypothetical protein [Streptomyces triticisoli]
MSEQPAVVSGIPAGLTLRGLDRDQTPVADWLCGCGHHQRATGHRDVQQLAARVTVGHCPHQGVSAA